MLRSLFTLWATAIALVSAAPSGDWNPWGGPPKCNPKNMQIRKDFEKLPPEERKDFTDAIKCLMNQPSNLDQAQYPAAINRYFDWAVTHVSKTPIAHLDGYFLTWHRMYLHLFEQDLKYICGFKGALPYWNWPSTAGRLESSLIFNGDAYSMSGNGLYVDSGPLILAPTFQLPKGSGGGCVTTGPFADMITTLNPIPIQALLLGTGVPPGAYVRNDTCLTRDLNDFVATTYTNWTEFDAAIATPDQSSFATALNGVLGGSSLGLHSGAHFTMGSPASNIFVSAQDPIWYPLHTFLDLMYVQWQNAHPELAAQLYGTMTANNAPPSANVTLDSMEPDWGYFGGSVPVSDLISTTAGPFCYDYEFDRDSYAV